MGIELSERIMEQNFRKEVCTIPRDSQNWRHDWDDISKRSKPVQVAVGRSFNAQSSSTEIVHRLVVHEKNNIHVFHTSMGEQYSVVRFYNRSGDLMEKNREKIKIRSFQVEGILPVPWKHR